MRSRIASICVGAAVFVLTSCMPSSMILSAGRSEYDIVNRYSRRSSVERRLGTPLIEEAVPPIELSSFKFPQRSSRENYRERNFLDGWEGSSGLDPKSSHVVVTHCRYVMRGKIVPHGYIGGSNATGLMTLGVSEIFSVPMAIAQVTPNSSIENTFDVWYSSDGQALAYTWSWKISENRPNKSLQPTATLVTPPAAQEIVPSVAVAEH